MSRPKQEGGGGTFKQFRFKNPKMSSGTKIKLTVTPSDGYQSDITDKELTLGSGGEVTYPASALDDSHAIHADNVIVKVQNPQNADQWMTIQAGSCSKFPYAELEKTDSGNGSWAWEGGTAFPS